MSVMASGAMGAMYGAATMVGKDEMNGRINPALEPDDDMDAEHVQQLRQLCAGGSKQDSARPAPKQVQTAF